MSSRSFAFPAPSLVFSAICCSFETTSRRDLRGLPLASVRSPGPTLHGLGCSLRDARCRALPRTLTRLLSWDCLVCPSTVSSWRIHSRGRPPSRLVSAALASCRPFGQPLAGGRSCSASAVSHRCDGFLCARSYGLVASRFRSWGSLRFRFGLCRSEDLHTQHLSVLSRRSSEELRPRLQLLLSSCLRAVRPCPPAVPLPGRWPCSTVRRLPSSPHRSRSLWGRRPASRPPGGE